LRNVIERLMLLSTEEGVDSDTVKRAIPQLYEADAPVNVSSGGLSDRVQQFEREVILAELKRCKNHVTNTAKALGLERSHLYKKAEQLGIDLRSIRQEPESSKE
jgi:two-component system nitrogen regulation response regulator NtrX